MTDKERILNYETKDPDPKFNWMPWLILIAVVGWILGILATHPGGE